MSRTPPPPPPDTDDIRGGNPEELGLIEWIRSLFAPRRPEGEPMLTANGLCYGTRLPDGRIILAPDFKVTIVSHPGGAQ